MKKYKGAIVILCCCIFVIMVSGTFLVSHAAYSKANTKTLILNGTMVGTFFDFRIDHMYLDNTTEINQMPTLSDGYNLDDTVSYCTLKNGSVYYPLSLSYDQKIWFYNLIRGSRCVLYFNTAPYYVSNSKYHTRAELYQSEPYYSYFYYFQGTQKVCGYTTTSSKEVCLMQPANTYIGSAPPGDGIFTTTQRNTTRNNLISLLTSLGITNYTCQVSTREVYCIANSQLRIAVSSSGGLYIRDLISGQEAQLNYDGTTELVYYSV